MAVTAFASGTKTAPYGTFTVTLASPAVFTKTAHGLAANDKVVFSTTGALPTGLTAGTTYFVISAGLAADTFEVSATEGGAAVNTSVSQSGTHTMTPEVFLSNVNVAGTYQLYVDKNTLAAGDAITLRVYAMVLTAGTSRVCYAQTYTDVQGADDLIAVSVPISTELTDAQALRFSLQQSAGTAHAFPWKVLKFA